MLTFLKKYRPTEDFARNLFQQLIFTVEYYHKMVNAPKGCNARRLISKGIRGLDLGLENIFYDFSRGTLKVIEFGLSDWSSHVQVYSLPFVAPEQLIRPVPTPKHTQASFPFIFSMTSTVHPSGSRCLALWYSVVLHVVSVVSFLSYVRYH